MTIVELMAESIDVLKTNKMRTALSVLGIIIGIGSVIALMTLGKAAQQSTVERISALGSNMLTITPGSESEGFLRGGGGSASTLTYADAQAIANEDRITTIDEVAAEYSSNAQVAYERNNSSVSVNGVTPDFFSIRNIDIESGSVITQSDVELLNKVAVLGPTVVTDLFGPGVNPLGQTIKINGTSFTVVGVTAEKGSTGRFNTDETVYVPLTTAQRGLFGVNHVSAIYVNTKNADDADAAENQLGYYLLELHRIKNPADADFSIFSSSELLATVSEVTGTFTTLLTGIAAISLVVGGIGIMNIMLVTVTERTKEIGIRKALGAKRRSITSQFLIEAIILTVVGGIIGVAVGVLISMFLTKRMGLPQIIAYESIGLAVAVSCVIGIIFGWYPAQRASKLQPIEALRYE